jgi:hypothetical protein
MPKIGNTVGFRVRDTFLNKWVNAIGKIEKKWIGSMWIISAKDQPGLQPNFRTWVHEDNINA